MPTATATGLRHRPPQFSRPRARNTVEALTQGIVNKLLHEPTIRLKDAAGTASGELYADALAALFDVSDGADSTEG